MHVNARLGAAMVGTALLGGLAALQLHDERVDRSGVIRGVNVGIYQLPPAAHSRASMVRVCALESCKMAPAIGGGNHGRDRSESIQIPCAGLPPVSATTVSAEVVTRAGAVLSQDQMRVPLRSSDQGLCGYGYVRFTVQGAHLARPAKGRAG